MPVASDNVTIIPSYDPNEFTPEKIIENAERLKKGLEELHGLDKPLRDCPTPIEPFISQSVGDDLVNNLCENEEPEKSKPFEEPEIEIPDSIECIQEGIDSIHKVADEIADESQKLSDLKELVQKIQEWIDNMEPVYLYHKAKFKSSDRKTALIIDPETKAATKLTLTATTLPAYIVTLRLYTSAVSVLTSIDSMFDSTIHYQWTDDIKKTNLLTNDEKSVIIDKIPGVYNTGSYKSKTHAKGKLYSDFYDYFNDPVANFFTPSERGLVLLKKFAYKQASMDELSAYGVATSEYIEVKSNGKTYYVGNDIDKDASGKTLYQKYSEFYSKTFPENYPNKVRKTFDDLHKTAVFKTLKAESESMGTIEGKLYNKYSGTHKKSEKLIKKYEASLKIVERLNSEISRIEKSLTQEEITNRLKSGIAEQSCDCQKLFDIVTDPVSIIDNDNLDGDAAYSNPFGGDPTLPDKSKLCYWMKFAELATIFNATLPFPDLTNPSSLRYWPVGITVPSPNGLIKIPFPTVFVPLVVLPLPIGTFVLFFAQTGIFPAVELFFMANDGSKNFILSASVSSIKSGLAVKGTDNFGFTTENMTDLLSAFPTEKIFKVPLLDVDKKIIAEQRKMQRKIMSLQNESVNKINDTYNDDSGKIEDEKKSISDLGDLEENDDDRKNNLINKLTGNDIDIMDEINRWKSALKSKINLLKDYEFGYELADSENVRKGIQEILYNKIEWPKFAFPSDFESINSEPIATKGVSIIKDFIQNGFSISTPTTLKELLREQVISLYNSEKLQELLDKLPEEIDISGYLLDKYQENKSNKYASLSDDELAKKEKAQENFENFKKWIKDALEWICKNLDPNIWHNDAMRESLNVLTAANLFHPFDCTDTYELELPEWLDINSFLILLSLADQALNAFTIEKLISMCGGKLKFNRGQALYILIDVLFQFIPDIPLIDIKGTMEELNNNAVKLGKDLAKLFTQISEITVDQVKEILLSELMKKFGLPIVIDTKIFILPIADAFMQEIGKYIALYEKYRTMKFSTTIIKAILNMAIDSVFGIASSTIKPYADIYEQIMKMINTVKAIKEMDIELNPADLAFNPIVSAKKLIEKPAKAEIWKKTIHFLGLDVWVTDPKLASAALLMLGKIAPLCDYTLVAAACAFGGKTGEAAIRLLHPINFEEDIPVYERLKLSNPLFVLFLDKFCYNAKKINGYSENYL